MPVILPIKGKGLIYFLSSEEKIVTQKKVNPKDPNIDPFAVNELLLRVEKLAIKRHVYYRIVSYEALNRRISF